MATLASVQRPRELPIAALPLLFGIHQFVEAFVWLGLEGSVSQSVLDAATRAYLIFAQGVLPILVPIGFVLIEPVRRRRRRMYPFAAIGVGVGVYLLGVTLFRDVGATADAYAIVYETELSFGFLASLAYVVATCGPALTSTPRYLRMFGAANLVMVVITDIVRSSAVVSLWCFAAALASVLIMLHFRHQERLTHGTGHGGREHRVLAALGH